MRVSLVESGLKDLFYFDAVHVYVHHYNCLPTDANRAEPGVPPNKTLGLKFSIKRLRPFGAPGTLLIKPCADITASKVPGKFCIFIGYGHDTPGYRVIVPSIGEIKIYTDIDIKISRSVVPCRDFLSKCRLDPTYAAIHGAWFDRVFEIQSEGNGNICEQPQSLQESKPDIADAAFHMAFPERLNHDDLTVQPVQLNGSTNVFVGKRIARYFKDKIYRGIITKYKPPESSDEIPLWHVVYDDGDEEDFNREELDNGIRLHDLNQWVNPNFDPRQTVGTNPQSQSRVGLRPHVPTKRSSSDLMNEDEAKSIIRDGRRYDKLIKFTQINPKHPGSKCGCRYDRYKRCTTFKDFDDLLKQTVDYTDSRGKIIKIKAAERGDLINDLCKGFLVVQERSVGALQTTTNQKPVGALQNNTNQKSVKHYRIP